MRAAIAFLLVLVASANAQTPATFGTAVTCVSTATTTYSFAMSSFTGGASITGTLTAQVTCSGTGTWTLDAYTGLSATAWATLMTQGYAPLNLGATLTGTVGLSLSASAGVDVTLAIATPDLSTNVVLDAIIKTFGSAGGAVTAEAGFVQVDASGNVQWVVPAQLDTSTKTSLQWTFEVKNTGSTTMTNNYILSGINLSVPNVAFSVSKWLGANANQTFVFTDTQTSIKFWASATAQFTASKAATTSNPAPPSTWGTWLNVYLTFDTKDASGSEVAFQGQADLMYQYNQAELTAAGISANAAANLKWAYYDTTAKAWTQAGGSVSGGVVATSTTHFSEWSMYASNTAAMLNANFFLVALAALVSYMLA